MNTISEVVSNKLCTGCGTCASACPNGAIKIRKFEFEGLYLPEIEGDKCKQCGICLICCPGHSVNFETLNSRIFGKQPNDNLLGNYQNCYIGYSNEPYVRYECASGGIASQLLIFALEKGMIDGAIVARMSRDQPLETEVFIARTRADVLNAARSKYCPVTINEALRNVLERNERYAVVGLPCHIHGIRKAEEVYGVLRKRIVLRIGLMCAHTVNFNGTELLLEKIGIDKEQVHEISYRGKGWPGCMTIKTKGGYNLSIPLIGGWKGSWSIFSCFFFTPKRCITCYDQTNELADISLGDAWIPEVRHDKIGTSVVIGRTGIGEDFLERISASGKVFLRQIPPEKVKESQRSNLKFKKNDMSIRLSLLKLVGHHVPMYKPKPSGSTGRVIVLVRTLFPLLNMFASHNKHLRFLLRGVPFSVFRLYYGIYKFASLV